MPYLYFFLSITSYKSFNNYVHLILPFFNLLLKGHKLNSKCLSSVLNSSKKYISKLTEIYQAYVWTFFTLSVDKNKHPPHFVHVVIEWP